MFSPATFVGIWKPWSVLRSHEALEVLTCSVPGSFIFPRDAFLELFLLFLLIEWKYVNWSCSGGPCIIYRYYRDEGHGATPQWSTYPLYGLMSYK